MVSFSLQYRFNSPYSDSLSDKIVAQYTSELVRYIQSPLISYGVLLSLALA